MFDVLYVRPALIAAGVACALCVPSLLRGSTPRTRAWARLAAVTLGAYATFVVVKGDGWWPTVTSRVDNGIWAVVLGAIVGGLAIWRGRVGPFACATAAVLMARLLWLERWSHERRFAFVGVLLLVLLSTQRPPDKAGAGDPPRQFGLWIALAGCAAVAPFAMALSFGQVALGVLGASVAAHTVLRREFARFPLPEAPLLALVVGTVLLSLHGYASLHTPGMLLIAAAPLAEGLVEYPLRTRLRTLRHWLPALVAVALTVAGVLLTRAANPHWNPYA